MSAAHNKADNLIAFVDYNHKQLDGSTEDVLDMGDIGAKFEAFGWYTQDINGHDVEAIYDAIEDAKKNNGGKPSMIVLQTVKGKGVKFIEETVANHHIVISKEQAAAAIVEVREA